jgi:hypothetical protein
MTLSRSNTPLGEKRELHESVHELDCLLEDLKNAQVSDERSYTKRLDQQSSFYNSTSSLNVPSGSRPNGSRQAASPAPLKKLASSSSKQQSFGQQEADQVDLYASRLESELNRSQDAPIPRGVFVKDVVEEEILVDHVLVPKQQQSDKKFITKQSDRKPGERAKRQVAFGGLQSRTTYDDDGESYDNNQPDDEQASSSAYQTRFTRDTGRHQTTSGSMQSLNSATTDQSEMTETSSILDPNKIINCHVCGERVIGQVITALGRNYHREHFTCAHCHQELGTRNFYERDNLPYCEKDYQQLFSPKCAACNEPILDKVTIALEQTFHPEHFVCAHCGCQFDVDDGFHEKDGKPYCKNDFFDLFANKCGQCNLPITANYITALGVQWHPDCFVCSDCHCPFGDGKFFDIDGLPYCEIHYHARRGSLCAVCREPIIGKCTTAMFRKFHPDHFTCTYCLKVLSKSFKEENDKPYCFECFDKLYS